MGQTFRQKKSLGQHFLKDKNIIRKIVSLGAIKPGEEVWEIGPGKGILTEELLKTNCNLTCFEVDKELFPILLEKFGNSIQLIKQDVIQTDWTTFFSNNKLKIISNLPYQITSPLLFKILDYRNHFSTIVIMIQKEVAERLKASPGSKSYSPLSIMMQHYFIIKYEFTVKPHLFYPPPKVDSAVVTFLLKEDVKPIENEDRFWNFVKVSFSNRRKMLRNNIKGFVSKDIYTYLMQNEPVMLSKRAEALHLKDFIYLFDKIK